VLYRLLGPVWLASIWACVTDVDLDGIAPPEDCDDTRADVHPGAEERCDGLDNDCDGIIDPPTSIDTTEVPLDADADHHGHPDLTRSTCSPPDPVPVADDCDDTEASIHPNAAEVRGDGIDQDCDGSDAVAIPDFVQAVLADPDIRQVRARLGRGLRRPSDPPTPQWITAIRDGSPWTCRIDDAGRKCWPKDHGTRDGEPDDPPRRPPAWLTPLLDAGGSWQTSFDYSHDLEDSRTPRARVLNEMGSQRQSWVLARADDAWLLLDEVTHASICTDDKLTLNCTRASARPLEGSDLWVVALQRKRTGRHWWEGTVSSTTWIARREDLMLAPIQQVEMKTWMRNGSHEWRRRLTVSGTEDGYRLQLSTCACGGEAEPLPDALQATLGDYRLTKHGVERIGDVDEGPPCEVDCAPR